MSSDVSEHHRGSLPHGSGCSYALILITAFAVTIVGIALIATWGIVNRISQTPPPPPPSVFVSQGPTITQLESLGTLTVLRVSIADVLVGEGEGYEASWLVKGDALISVNCRSAQIVERDEEKKHAVIVLSVPQVVQPRIDHTRTRKWDSKKTTWVPFGGNLSKLERDAMIQAQKLVEEAASAQEITDQAKQNAKLVIQEMYRLVDWEVEVRWNEGK